VPAFRHLDHLLNIVDSVDSLKRSCVNSEGRVMDGALRFDASPPGC